MTPRAIVEAFYAAMNSNDFTATTRWLAEDFECFWPQSAELICGRHNFAAINSAYPANGRWVFETDSLIADGNQVVTSVRVTDGVVKARAITFHVVENGLISRQTEYWPDPFEAPAWRRQWVQLCGSQNETNHTADPFSMLYEKAKAVLKPRKISRFAEAASVGAALQTDSGNIFTGVCIDTASSMGFCAEHAAAAAMLTAGETRVVRMLAVDWDGRIIPPCGRCREFISQLHDENHKCEVKIDPEKIMTLSELLPFDWKNRCKQRS